MKFPPARRASLILHYCLHRRAHSRKAPLCTLDKFQQTAAGAPPLGRRLHQNPSAELSVAPVSCQQKQTSSDGQAEYSPQLPGKDALVPLGVRSKKGGSRKQKVGSHADVKEVAQSHSLHVTDSRINTIELSASKGNLHLFGLDQALCNNGDANSLDHAPKIDSSGVSVCMTHSQTGYELKVCSVLFGDSAVLSTSDCSLLSGFNACETCAFAKGNDSVNGPSTLTDPSVPLQPLEDALQAELLRKVKMVESILSPTDAASLLKRRACKSCSSEQLETVLQLLREYHVSSERALKVLVMNPGVLSVDLLQKKLQVLVDFHIEKETIGRLCMSGRTLRIGAEALQKKLAFLEELGLNVEAKNKIFRIHPSAIAFTIQSFKSTVGFLSGMGVTKEKLVRLIQSCPHLLRVSCSNNLTPRYHFFQKIGIPALKLPFAVCSASRTSMDSIEAHMQSLKDLGFSHDDVCLMVQKEPGLLWRANIQRLKMTFDFVVHEQEYNMADIMRYPIGLMLSLERRIIPRCRLVEERGLSKVYSLATILSYSDSRFKKLLSKRKGVKE